MITLSTVESAKVFLSTSQALSCQNPQNAREIALHEYCRVVAFEGAESVAKFMQHSADLALWLESEAYSNRAQYWSVSHAACRAHFKGTYAETCLRLCGGRKETRGWTNAPSSYTGFIFEVKSLPDDLHPDYGMDG